MRPYWHYRRPSLLSLENGTGHPTRKEISSSSVSQPSHLYFGLVPFPNKWPKVSDDTVKLGTLPTDVIVQQLATLCSESGQCDTGSVDITGYYLVQGQNQIAETVTINPSGIYPTWIHRGLFEALAAAVNAVAKCEKTTVTKDDCEPSSRGCGGKGASEPAYDLPWLMAWIRRIWRGAIIYRNTVYCAKVLGY